MKICKKEDCDKILRSTNTTGFCNQHRRLSPEVKLKEQKYRDKNKNHKKEYDKKYRDENEDKISKEKKKYREKNREALIIKDKNRYQKNRENRLNKQKNYYIENKEEILEYNKEYHKKNFDVIAKKRKEYAEQNKDRIKAYMLKYLNSDRGKEVAKQNHIKRRGFKNSVKEKIDKREIEAIFKAFESKCFCCGSKENLCLDHFYPLSLGFPLKINNAIILCRRCNSSKSNKMPETVFNKKDFNRVKKIMKLAAEIYKKVENK